MEKLMTCSGKLNLRKTLRKLTKVKRANGRMLRRMKPIRGNTTPNS